MISWSNLSMLLASIPDFDEDKPNDENTEGDYDSVEDELAALKKFGI